MLLTNVIFFCYGNTKPVHLLVSVPPVTIIEYLIIKKKTLVYVANKYVKS